jgi:hypothetical protein
MRISGNPQREEQTVCKVALEGISHGWKMNLQNSEILANMNVTTFIALQFDTKHFKHAMNAIIGGSLKDPSNVN